MIRKFWMLAAAALTLVFAQSPAIAQYGPPASGPSAAIVFVPATVNLIAGLNGTGYGGDGGPANSSNTKLNSPAGVAFDSSGNLFIADAGNHVVRRIDHTTGYISTFAGQQNNPGYPNGSAVATSAQFEEPWGLAMDSSNNLYMSDLLTNTVWKITPGGVISILAGGGSGSCSGTQTDTLGDGCPATDAKLSRPEGLGIDANNNLYIADVLDYVIREVSSATGKISIFAGSSTCGGGLYSTSAGPYTATQANLCNPSWIAFDSEGNSYISDTGNNVIRIVNSGGDISTFAGGGSDSYTMDGVPATAAALSVPEGVYVDPANRVYISDYFDGAIRQVNSQGNIYTVMGNYYDLSASSIGEPDTGYGSATGTADNETFTMDVYGNIVATERSPAAVTSAGATGQYVFANQQVYTTSSPAYVTVLNPSGVALNFTGTPTVSGPFAIVTGAGAGTCNLPGSVAPGASCTIGITFSPTADQAYTGSIVLDSNANSSPSTINLSGTGTGTGTPPPAPVASLSPNPLAFTDQVAGTTSEPMQATLSNSGNAALSYSVSISGAGFASVTGTSACGTTGSLVAGSSCFIYATFTPTSATSFSGSIQVTDNNNAADDTSATLNGTGVGFSSQIGIPQPTQTVTVGITTAGTPASIQVLAQGVAALDFAETSGGTCNTTTAYTVGQTCTVNVIFDPVAPGIRPGVAELLDGSGNVLGITYLPGYATGPEIAFGTAPQSSLLPTPTSYTVTGVAASAGGNVFFVDNAGGAVYQLTKTGNNTYSSPTQIGSGYTEPFGVAVDGAGNVYVGGYGGFDIIKIPWTGSAYGTQTTVPLGTTTREPRHLTVDALGDIFFADYAQDEVVEVPWTSSGYGTPVVLPFTGLSSVNGVAVDQNGDVFAANTYGHNVLELPWTGTGRGTQVTVVPSSELQSGVGAPIGLALDAAGDLYVAEQHTGFTGSSYLIKVPFTGGTYGTPVTIPITLSSIYDVAINGSGDPFVASTLDQQVYKLDTQDPPTLTFKTATNVGSTDTTDGPQTATITNIGNASLAFGSGTNPQYLSNFPENSLDTSLCAQGTSLLSTASCDVSVNFVPNAAGANSGSVMVTDNNLNVSGTNQKIPVNGTGVGASLTAQTITFTQPTTPITWASSLTVTLVATGGASGNPVVFSIDGSSTGTGGISGSTLSITAPGTFVIDANQTGNASYSAAPQVQRTFLVNKAPQTINFTAPTSPVTYNAGLTISLVATGGASGNPVTFSIDAASTATGSIAGSTLTVSSTGNLVIDANQTGNADYSAATQVQQTIVVNSIGTQTITFTQPTTPITYAPSLTVSLVATGGASGNPVLFTIDGSSTGTGSISGTALSITTPGTFVIDANQTGNSNYSAAAQVQRTLVVNKAPQTINFTAPTSPVTYNTGLTISLVATGGASGNAVTFSIDAASTATGSITGSTLNVTSTGTFAIDANQTGNTDYAAATQVQQTITVNAPTPQTISFTQPTSPNTYAPSLTVTLVATGGASGNAVVFTIDGSSTGTGSISGSTLTITSVGTFVIDANQSGNANYTAAPQVQRTVVVTQAPQVINFTQPTSPVTYAAGLTITLTATGGASSNAVVFTIDSTSTASATVSGSTVTVTSAGNLVIDANQAGNADYSAAPQVQRTVVINAPPGDFSISASPGSQTVNAGATANYTITVDSINAFGNNVALSVTGYPPGSTVTFSPPQINPGSGPATSTLSIVTAAGLFAQAQPSSSLWPVATPTLALLLLLPFRRWRKAVRGKLFLLVAGLASLATAAALTGCGGGFALPQTSQSYTLTITGTSGSDTHSTTVQLTVQ